jgi:3-phosphoshikimate 1-carboxyvinyltransferase
VTVESLARRPSGVRATVSVPGSKSISNRALVCAALTEGVSTISGLADGDDTRNMLAAFESLGLQTVLHDREARIVGPIDFANTAAITLDAGLAGTTSRFLTAVASLRVGATTVTGAPGLLRRPMGELHRLLRSLGADVTCEREGQLPVTIRGVRLATNSAYTTASSDVLRTVTADGSTSSQFISALMMIGPALGGIRIILDGPVVSGEYLHMTKHVMLRFGAEVTVDEHEVLVARRAYSPTTFEVDADWSSASYPMAAAAIAAGTVRVTGLREHSEQPEAAFVDVLRRIGCSVRFVRDTSFSGVEVSRPHDRPLCGGSFDMSSMSDLVPTLAVIAACATTPTEIHGVGYIRSKESDRLGDLAHELNRCGASVTVLDDGLRIQPGQLLPAIVDPHDDHRLAMALGLLGLQCDGIQVENAEVVAKSWPDFWTAMTSL